MGFARRILELINVVYYTFRMDYQTGVSLWNDEPKAFLEACRNEAQKRGVDVDALFEGIGIKEIRTILFAVGVWYGGFVFPFYSYSALSMALLVMFKRDPEFEKDYRRLSIGGLESGGYLFLECEIFKNQVCAYGDIFRARHKYMPSLFYDRMTKGTSPLCKLSISRVFKYRLSDTLVSSIEAPPPVLIEISLRRRAIAIHMDEMNADPSVTEFTPLAFEKLISNLYIPAEKARLVLNHPNSHFIRYEHDCYAPTNLRGEPLFPTKDLPREEKSFNSEPCDEECDDLGFNLISNFPGGKPAFHTFVREIIARIDATPKYDLIRPFDMYAECSMSLLNLIYSYKLTFFGSPLQYPNLPEDAELGLEILKDAYKGSCYMFALNPLWSPPGGSDCLHLLPSGSDYVPDPDFFFQPLHDNPPREQSWLTPPNMYKYRNAILRYVIKPIRQYRPLPSNKNIEAPMSFYRSKITFHYSGKELQYPFHRIVMRLELHREFDPILSSVPCKEYDGAMTFNGDPFKRVFFPTTEGFQLSVERQKNIDYRMTDTKEPSGDAETPAEEITMESTASEITDPSRISLKGVPIDSARVPHARGKNKNNKKLFLTCKAINPNETEEPEEPKAVEELPPGVKELGDFLRSLFDQSYVVLYYSKLLERRPDLFRPFDATSLQGVRDALRQVAQTVFPELRAGDQFVVLETDAELEDFDLLCFQIVLRWGTARATTPDELAKDLYIPLSIIKRTLSAGSEFTQVGTKKYACQQAAQETRKLQAQESRKRFAEIQLAKRVDELIDENHLFAYYDKFLEASPWLKACGIRDVETLKSMLANIPKEREDGEAPRELTLHDDYVDLVQFNDATLEEKTRRALHARWARLPFNKKELESLNAYIGELCEERSHLPEASVKRMTSSVVLSKLTMRSILKQRLSSLRSRLLLPAELVGKTIRNAPNLFQFDETTQLFTLLNEKGEPATHLDAVRIIFRGYDGSLTLEGANAAAEKVEPQVEPTPNSAQESTETTPPERAATQSENATSENVASQNSSQEAPTQEETTATATETVAKTPAERADAAPEPKETPRERLVKSVSAFVESGANILYYATLLERDATLQNAYRDANALRGELEKAFPKYKYGVNFFEPAKSPGSEDEKILLELLTRWGAIDRLKFDKLVRNFCIPAALLERVLKDKSQFFEFCGKARYAIKAEGRKEGRRFREKVNELQERLRREINELLDVEGTILFYSSYFQRNADWLQEIKIDSEIALRSRLARELPDRVFYQVYCEGVESTLRFREKVERTIAAGWGKKPMQTTDEIASRVYVPREYIQGTLESSFDFIFCGHDKYRRA